MPRYLSAIALLILVISLAFLSTASSRGPDTSTRTLDAIKSEVAAKLDLDNPYIADTAMTMAADYPGELSINQVSEIYNTMAQGGWFYYNDPAGAESYQNANLSLKRGKVKNTIGMGDCDDFAILMTSLVQSIGGSARLIFAYDDQNRSGHAYSELYLGKSGTAEVTDILRWLKSEYRVDDLSGINKTGEEVWLNLDWGNDITKAAYPGGHHFGEGSKNVRREIVWEPKEKVSPVIVPVIDSMDSINGWQAIDDGNGSTIAISSAPGKKGNAVQLSYDLREGGWVGITKEVDPVMLSKVAGLNFSSFIMDKQNTIQLSLIYDGMAWGASWSNLKADTWSSNETLYSDLKCLGPENKCSLNEEINTSKAKRLEFRISNDPATGDDAGPGMVILDEVRGLMAIPVGSAWARGEEQRETTTAKDLAYESEQTLNIPGKSIEGIKLAIESLTHHDTFEGEQAIRLGLVQLPRAVAAVAEMKHNAQVRSIAFSPDGTILATGCDDGRVRLWNASTGDNLSDRPLPHNDWIRSIDFSPDGKRLATGCDDGNARIWYIYSDQEPIELHHNGPVNSVAFSPDGTRLASGGDYGAVRTWNISNNTPTIDKVLDLQLAGDIKIWSVAYSPDGKRLAVALSNGTIRVWNASTGDLMLKTQRIHSDQVHCIAFSPNGTLLATGSRDAKAKILNASTGKELISLDHGNAVVESVAFSPDGTKLATASNNDHTARIWNLSTRKVVARMEHNSSVREGWVRSIAFSPEGKRVATASNDGTAVVWDIDTGELACLQYDNYVSSIAFSPDGTKLASASEDGMAKIWNLSTRKLQFYPLKHDSGVMSIVFGPDGKKLATGCRGGKAAIWDASDGKNLTPWLEHNNNSSVNCVAFSADGTKLATASDDHACTIWETSTGKRIVKLPHEANVSFVAFSPDGTKLATASRDSTYAGDFYKAYSIIKVWNVSKWDHLFDYPMQGGNINTMEFSPDGTRLAIGGQLGAAEVLYASNGTQLFDLREDAYDVYSMDFSPDGEKLAVTGMDQKVWIFDAYTGKPILDQKLDGFGYSVDFSPDSTKLATACSDKTARIWDISTKKEIFRMLHDDVSLVAFSPDGTKLATGSKDGTARVWYLRIEDLICEACSRLGSSLTSQEWREEYCSKCNGSISYPAG